MDNDPDIFEILTVPGSRKRRKVAKFDVEPVVAAKRKKKRGMGIRVAMRERLRAKRKALRLSHWAARRKYKALYKKLTQGIRQLTARKPGSNSMKDV